MTDKPMHSRVQMLWDAPRGEAHGMYRHGQNTIAAKKRESWHKKLIQNINLLESLVND